MAFDRNGRRWRWEETGLSLEPGDVITDPEWDYKVGDRRGQTVGFVLNYSAIHIPASGDSLSWRALLQSQGFFYNHNVPGYFIYKTGRRRKHVRIQMTAVNGALNLYVHVYIVLLQ